MNALFECLECGHKIADDELEMAVMDEECPNCGSTDIDIADNRSVEQKAADARRETRSRNAAAREALEVYQAERAAGWPSPYPL